MESFSLRSADVPVSVRISCFRGKNGVDEYHMALYPRKLADFEVQMNWLFRAYSNALASMGLDVKTAVLRRFFCSDLPNQSDILEKLPFSSLSHTDETCGLSWVCQPPGPSARISLWAYHVSDASGPLNKLRKGNSLSLKRGGLTHYWTCGVNSSTADTSYEQTLGILGNYDTFLRTNGMSLENDVIRTWFLVQNIDINYGGFVTARKEFFCAHGLTENTHFISSTAVQGSHTDVFAKVTMDAYSISGLKPGQIKFLHAPEHLSSTYVYGVTFERGTSVAYRDRKHVIISGTASIDSRGDILYQGNLSRQLDRTLENIEALLEDAGAALKDMAILITYVRDPADYSAVRRKMKERFRDTPLITVCSDVCRPGWLVEVEGIAVIPSSDATLPPF